MNTQYVLQPDGGLLAVEDAVVVSPVEASTQSVQEKFLEHDPDGIGITVIAMSVVLSALAVLSIVFILVSRLVNMKWGKSAAPSVTKEGKRMPRPKDRDAVVVAISMALHEHAMNLRDEEMVNLTIEQISRRYSPWSSKVYTVLNNRLMR
ncbi:MAG: OadG family protein [Bacteroides sp.]|jgi:Oxaloacetate decarboxylase, gamma chain.